MFDRIQEMIRNEGSRLIIDINYLRSKDLQRSQRFIYLLFNLLIIITFKTELKYMLKLHVFDRF